MNGPSVFNAVYFPYWRMGTFGGCEHLDFASFRTWKLPCPLPPFQVFLVATLTFVFRNRGGGGVEHMELWYMSGCFRWRDDGGPMSFIITDKSS